ncbi:calcium/sodium antiporter [soil metagenome]
MTLLLFLAGLVTLVAGGELLVRGAARLAGATGVSPLVIGLTVVAFGTSAPELAVSVQSGMAGQGDIAVGNVVGSNIFNVLLILGMSAAIVPLVVSRQLVRVDVPVMIAVSAAMVLLTLDGHLSRAESLMLVLGLVTYIVAQIVMSRRAAPLEGDVIESGGSMPRNLLLILIGLTLLVLGSRWLVDASVMIAQVFGITELVIGLTIVAAGTSMPELATSIIAGMRGQRDIAVGNVVGSNIFNILAVLGISGLLSASGIPVSTAAITLDIPIMFAVAVLCLPIFYSGARISRWEGLLFVVYYVLYTVYLVLDSANHGGLQEYRAALLGVVLPLTVLTIAGSGIRAWRDRDAGTVATPGGGARQ